VYAQGAHIVDAYRAEHQKQKPPVPGTVEDAACGQQHSVLPLVIKHKVQSKHNNKKYKELECVKKHTLFPRE
jgi:hypothetical protein